MQIVGDVEELLPQHLRLRSDLLGQLTVDRQRALRISQHRAISATENDATKWPNWKILSQPSDWQVTAHGCSTGVRGASISASLPVEQPLEFHLRIRWQDTANFVIGFGTQHQARANIARRAIQVDGARVARHDNRQEAVMAVEAWAGKLFLVLEAGKRMESVTLGDFGVQSGTLNLVLYPETETTSAAVQILGGPRFELRRPENAQSPRLEEVLIRNQGHFLSIDDFSIPQQSTQRPVDHIARKSLLMLSMGSPTSGGVRAWDVLSDTVDLEVSNDARRIPTSQLLSARILPAHESVAASATIASGQFDSQPQATHQRNSFPEGPDEEWYFSLRDGSQVQATVVSVKDGLLIVRVPGIQEELTIDGGSIVYLHPGLGANQQRSPECSASTGTLFVGSSQFKGSLVPTPFVSNFTALHWLPACSRTCAELISGVSAQLQFTTNLSTTVNSLTSASHESSEHLELESRKTDERTTFSAKESELLDQPILTHGTASEAKLSGRESNVPGMSSIELTTGDVVRAVIERMDEKSVHVRSPDLPLTALPHEWIRRLLFSDSSSEPTMTDEQKERLFTVPRTGQRDPPTHLLVSRSGDVLRGSRPRMSEGLLTIEIRGRAAQFSTKSLSEIVWLHERSWEAEQPDNSNRIRIFVDDAATTLLGCVRIEDEHLFGTSRLFGEVQFQLSRVSRILVGSQPQNRSYELRLAPSPK